MTYREIQDDVVRRYNIELCGGTLCRNDWHRTHAHPEVRRVCKWLARSSAQATFELMHEIGHIETSKRSMRRCESEYYATLWAIRCAAEYGMQVPEKTLRDYQRYILIERERGVRRGGKLPPASALMLPGVKLDG